MGHFDFLGVRPHPLGYQWPPGKRHMMPLILLIGARGGGGAGGGGGGSEYQGLTPTVEVDTVAELGSELASATAGTIIGGLPSVLLHSTGGSPYRSNVPGWHPANSGSSGSPIIIVGKYDPILMVDPLTDSNRFELQAGSGSYDGTDSHPCFGANTRNYIRWRNIVCDERDCITKPDNGPVYIAASTGTWIDHCAIRGTTEAAANVFSGDNHSGVRIGEGGTTELGHVVTNNKIWNFTLGLGTNAAGIITYGGQNETVDHNEIWDCTTGIYIKGSGASVTTYNYGSVSYNHLYDVQAGIRTQDTDGSNDLIVEHNLVESPTAQGLFFTVVTASTTRRIKMRRNTVVLRVASTVGVSVKALTGTGNEFNDNIVAVFDNLGSTYMDGGEYTANNFTAYDYNGFYGSTATNKWSWNGANQTTIAELHSAVATSNNNQILGSNPFVDQAAGDYTVTGAATTASSTGGPIGADFSQVGPQ